MIINLLYTKPLNHDPKTSVNNYEADDLLPLGRNPPADEIPVRDILRRFRLASLLTRGPLIDWGLTFLVKQYWLFCTDE